MPKRIFFAAGAAAAALGLLFILSPLPTLAWTHDSIIVKNGNADCASEHGAAPDLACGNTITACYHQFQTDGPTLYITNHDATPQSCKLWQKPQAWTFASTNSGDGNCNEMAGYVCACDKDCIKPPKDPRYYDHPTATGATQPDNNKITLPALLTWADPNQPSGPRHALGAYDKLAAISSSYTNNSSDNTLCSGDAPTNSQPVPPGDVKSYLVDFLVYYTADVKDPSKRAIRFDKKEPPDPNNLTPQNSEGKLIDGTGPNGSPAKLLEFVTDNPTFNSRSNGWPCFFNSDSKIQWRVRPCCADKSQVLTSGNGKNNDSMCQSENLATWWNFNTVTAPEPLGVTDIAHSAPQADPDWNGPAALTSIDFCTAGLHWCSAKVDPASSQEKFQQGTGTNQALDYQMALTYNEADELSALLSSSNWLQDLISNPLKYAGAIWTKIGGDPHKKCHYLMVDKTTSVCRAETVASNTSLKIPATQFSNSTDRNFNRDFFTKNLTYNWSLKRCFDNPNAGDQACTQNIVANSIPTLAQNFGQIWSLTTSGATLGKPTLNKPSDNATTPVAMPPIIAWNPPCGANSFEYKLFENGNSTPLVNKATNATQITFVKNTSAGGPNANNENAQADIKLNHVYTWQVQACWPSVAIQGGALCDGNWTKSFSFLTTGKAPQNLKVAGDNPSNIPATFSWSQVPGAVSYVLDLSPAAGTHITKVVPAADQSKPVSIQISYPDLKPKFNYAWKVKTCTDTAGAADNCGDWSPPGPQLTTGTLPAPGNPSPHDISSQDNYPARLSWTSVKGAVFYHVTMDYSNTAIDATTRQTIKETNPTCPTNGQLFDAKTDSASYGTPSLSLACLGTYTWGVASCFSADCKAEETGKPTTWRFFISKGEGKPSGFLVCGLRDDDLSTPWDERKACEFGDLFKLVWKIINFALFKLSFWLLPILAAITSGLFYTQAGGQDVLNKVKTMWKAIGIGYALLFFAWLLTNWALQALGYHGLWTKVLM